MTGPTVCWQATQTYPCEALTPRRAREFVADQFLSALGPDSRLTEAQEIACIVTSELVTNAFNARGTRTRLSIAFHTTWLRISVADDAPGRPIRRTAAPTDDSGRGLQIVAALAREWGVEESREGKSVWAELNLPVTGTETLACHQPAVERIS